MALWPLRTIAPHRLLLLPLSRSPSFSSSSPSLLHLLPPLRWISASAAAAATRSRPAVASVADAMAQRIGKSVRRPGAASKARVYADINVHRPKEYWDYETLAVQWG